MTDKIDPFDVEALEKSLNDSATRVSTIWISFLIFGLYLVIAAGTITHRQLFLEDPIKLPVLNIDLPLIGFSFVAPVLFVIFDMYVLLQVLLLARTAAAYNTALDRAIKWPTENASMRQRLANTLFAQAFAGSPRERKGWLGFLLHLMALLTLVIGPVVVLLVLQFQLLPFHSYLVTWSQRILIALDLMLVMVLWPALRDPDGDLVWRFIFWRWTAPSSIIVVIALAWIFLTFPGEFHAGWTRFLPEPKIGDSALASRLALSAKIAPGDQGKVDCRTISPISFVFPSFDRINLPHVDVIDHEKLKSIEANTRADGEPDYQGQRTQILRERDLNCGNFSQFADLRRVDLTGASLSGASLERAKLQGASLADARLQGANFLHANLQGASLARVQLQGASLTGAQVQGASFYGANLEGAYLVRANLQGASFSHVDLEGASLVEAQLAGASLEQVNLLGASLIEANLQGVFMNQVQLQGANLRDSTLELASLLDVSIWRARKMQGSARDTSQGRQQDRNRKSGRNCEFDRCVRHRYR